MKTSNLKELILSEMERIEFDVFLRSDFAHLGSYSLIGKALSELREESKILRLGKGLYCLAKVSRLFPGEIVPKADGLPGLARKALTRLGYKVVLSTAQRDNIERRSTQVPTGRRIGIEGRQPKIRIGYDDVFVTYEDVR